MFTAKAGPGERFRQRLWSSSIATDSPALCAHCSDHPRARHTVSAPLRSSLRSSSSHRVTPSRPGLCPHLHRSCHQWLQGAFPEHSVFSVPPLSSLAPWDCPHYLGLPFEVHSPPASPRPCLRPPSSAAPKFCPRPFSFLPACGSYSSKTPPATVAGPVMPHIPRESSVPSAHHVPSLGTPPGPSR